MKKKYGIFSQSAGTPDGAYILSTPSERADTASRLIENASLAKQKTSQYWKKMKRYYDGLHDINYMTDSFLADMNIPWTPAQSNDGYVHVESQVNAELPGFEFSPFGDYSSDAAKVREDMVSRVLDVNMANSLNLTAERRLGIYGSSVWKVSWGDIDSDYGRKEDVLLGIPYPEQIFTDPSADTVDGCEYIAYVYPMHTQKARRVFAEDIGKRNGRFEEYLSNNGTGIVFEDCYDDENTVTVTEFWFRQPCDAHGNSGIRYKAGDIALSVLINGKEIRYIPKYWQNTECDMFPFVIANKVPNDGSIWGKSELEMLIPLIDASDRELTFAQLNSAFCSNDIVLCEENAFSDGKVPDNSPGAVWKLRPGMMGKVQRLGNMGATASAQFNSYSVYQSMMEQTAGNFDVNQGKEPSKVTTASGIALMNERSQSRLSRKNAGRSEGFKRLYALIDKTCTEFYEDGRKILCKGKSFDYEFSKIRITDGINESVPNVDVKIHIGDGIANSKAFTVSALNSLIGMNINEDNYMFVKAYVDLIGIPERNEICKYLEDKYGDSYELWYENLKGDNYEGKVEEILHQGK